MRDGADTLAAQLAMAGIPGFVREHRFHAERKWRLDLAHLEHKLAVEVEGGIWINGRHSRGKGFLADCEKYAQLAIDGWRLIRVATDHVKSGEALLWIERALQRGNQCANEKRTQ